MVEQAEDKIFWKDKFSAQSETLKVIAVCSKLNRHVQKKVDERRKNNLHEEFWVM